MIGINASLYYIAKLSKTMKWLKIKMPLSCQNCPVIDGRLTVECPKTDWTGTVPSPFSGVSLSHQYIYISLLNIFLLIVGTQGS